MNPSAKASVPVIRRLPKYYRYLRSLKENYPGSESDIFEMINSRLDEWAVAGGDAK